MSSLPLPRLMSKAWDIYARELLPLGYGYPLWGPEPDEAYGEVRLGDVGYIWDGHFNFLFNCMLGGDDPVNSEQGVPDDFEIFSPPNSKPIKRSNKITASTTLHSQSVRVDNVSMGLSAGQAGVAAAAGIRFMCQEESGAVLLMKRPGHQTYLNCDLYIKRYMKRNLDSWEAFIRDQRGIDLEDKDIIFVYGFTKTTVWAEAAFRSGGSDVGLVLSGGALVPSISGDIEISHMRASKPSVISRSGPPGRVAEWDNVSSDTDETFDQCIFLNFYKMKKRWLLPDFVIRAAAGPGDHDLQDGKYDQNRQVSTTAVGNNSGHNDFDFDTIEETANFDPVNQILDYILQNSDADVACASDRDLLYVCQDNYLLDDIPPVMVALGISTCVDLDGIGAILPPPIAIKGYMDVSMATGPAMPVPISLLSDRYADVTLQDNQENLRLAVASLRDYGHAAQTANEYRQGQEDCLPSDSDVAAVSRRITDGFIEARRKENVVKSLNRRVEDWKGHHVSWYGALHLDGIFKTTRDKVDQVYEVFLFKEMLLLCKDFTRHESHDDEKSADESDAPQSPLAITVRIPLTKVMRIERIRSTALFPLDVWWRGSNRSELLTLYLPNQEQLERWHDHLDNFIRETANRRSRPGSDNNNNAFRLPNSVRDDTHADSGHFSPALGHDLLVSDNSSSSRVPPRPSSGGPLPRLDWELPESSTDPSHSGWSVQSMGSVPEEDESMFEPVLREPANHHREKTASIPPQRLAFVPTPSPSGSNHVQYQRHSTLVHRALAGNQGLEEYRPRHPGSFNSSLASSADSRYSMRSRESVRSTGLSPFSTSTTPSSITSYGSTGESVFGMTKDHIVWPDAYPMWLDQGSIVRGPANLEVHHQERKFSIFVPLSTEYYELITILEMQIRTDAEQPRTPFGVWYWDENGVLARLESTDDVQMMLASLSPDEPQVIYVD